jgi:hypothetical protein
MMDVNQTPPEKMTPEQRRQEIGSILANGLIRLRNMFYLQSQAGLLESKFDLDSSGQGSVHSNPSTR